MADIREIPDRVKWRFAAQCSATLPALYDIAFREALKERYGLLEREIWMELAHALATIAHDCALAARNADDIAKAVQAGLYVLFGPNLGAETIAFSDDRAVIVIKRCPFLIHSSTLATDCGNSFARCMALVLTAVPLLNKEFEARFVRALCTGDRQCEILIEKKPPAKKAGSA
jgi:hypothetical protein